MHNLIMTYPHSLGTPGGGTKGCIQIALHLARCGIRVSLIAVSTYRFTSYPRPALPPEIAEIESQIESQLKAEGVNVISVPPNRFHWVLDGWSVRREAAEILRQENVCAVIGWHQETLFLPFSLMKKGVKRAQISAGNYLSKIGRSPKAKWRHVVLNRAFRQSDVVFTLSDATGIEIETTFGLAKKKL